MLQERMLHHGPLHDSASVVCYPMGLSVYYTLGARYARFTTIDALTQGLKALRQYALDQPFESVGPIERSAGSDTVSPDDEFRTGELAKCLFAGANEGWDLPSDVPDWVQPTESVGFRVQPGKGTETAEIRLGRFPAMLGGRQTRAHDRWHGSAFCKTQYASVHSTDYFVQVHVALISLFDHARELGFDTEVRDDSGFADHRDPAQLIESVDQMNRLVAAFTGAFKDAMDTDGKGGTIKAAIFEHPRFEYLEAEGRSQRDGKGIG